MKTNGAVISACGKYRYELTRDVGPEARCVNFIMLNPSTADATEDDPTIRRCIGYARAWGCGELIVTNLFAYRATDPHDLKSPGVEDPVGPRNYEHVKAAADYAIHGWETWGNTGLVVCAWGNHGVYMDQDRTVLGWIEMYGQPMALRVSKTQQPAHPLYLPKDLEPQPYKGRT